MTVAVSTAEKTTINHKTYLGDYVKSNRHGHIGRVYGIKEYFKLDGDWVAGQQPPYTHEEESSRFIDILVHGGGAVCVPECSIERIDPIVDFEHLYSDYYFRD